MYKILNARGRKHQIDCTYYIYRSQTDNIPILLHQLHISLQQIHKSNLKVVICEHFNINFLIDRCIKYELEAFITRWNLKPCLSFPVIIKIL